MDYLFRSFRRPNESGRSDRFYFQTRTRKDFVTCCFCWDPTVDLCAMHLGINFFREPDTEEQIPVYSLPSCSMFCYLLSV